MKVFLDDERSTPEGWWRTYDPIQTISLLKSGMVTHLSLDHDLGDDDLIGTGNDVILWIEEHVAINDFTPPFISVHSANSSARQKMESGIRQISKLYETRLNVS